MSSAATSKSSATAKNAEESFLGLGLFRSEAVQFATRAILSVRLRF